MVYDTPPVLEVKNANPREKTWLFTFDRDILVYRELLHILWADCVVDWTPGNGTLAYACIVDKLPVVVVAKNKERQQVLERHLKKNHEGHGRHW